MLDSTYLGRGNKPVRRGRYSLGKRCCSHSIVSSVSISPLSPSPPLSSLTYLARQLCDIWETVAVFEEPLLAVRKCARATHDRYLAQLLRWQKLPVSKVCFKESAATIALLSLPDLCLLSLRRSLTHTRTHLALRVVLQEPLIAADIALRSHCMPRVHEVDQPNESVSVRRGQLRARPAGRHRGTRGDYPARC